MSRLASTLTTQVSLQVTPFSPRELNLCSRSIFQEKFGMSWRTPRILMDLLSSKRYSLVSRILIQALAYTQEATILIKLLLVSSTKLLRTTTVIRSSPLLNKRSFEIIIKTISLEIKQIYKQYWFLRASNRRLFFNLGQTWFIKK